MARLLAFVVLATGVFAFVSSARGDEAEDKAKAFVTMLKGKLTTKGSGQAIIVLGVSFSKVDLTAEQLRELAPFKKLTELKFEQVPLTDVELKEVVIHKNLTRLGLVGAKITDDGLKQLAVLEKLDHLHLTRTNITDKGLKELAILGSLKQLDLRDTKVTDEGVAELQKALPKCKIMK